MGASRQQVAKHGTLTWLTDIAGLSRDAAIELMRWSAGAMLEAAVANWRAVDASPTL